MSMDWIRDDRSSQKDALDQGPETSCKLVKLTVLFTHTVQTKLARFRDIFKACHAICGEERLRDTPLDIDLVMIS